MHDSKIVECVRRSAAVLLEEADERERLFILRELEGLVPSIIIAELRERFLNEREGSTH